MARRPTWFTTASDVRLIEASLDSSLPRGVMASYSASTGAPPPVEVSTLAKNSLLLTRPSRASHATDVAQYQERAADVFSAVAAGIIKPAVWKTFPLAEAAAPHAALGGGTSRGRSC